MDFKLRGRFHAECRNPDGSLAWRAALDNGITTAGLTDLLSAGFAAGTQRSWYLGLIDSSGYTAVAAADSMTSHSGWTELTGYSAGTRPAWSPVTAAGAVASGPVVSFSLTAGATLKGFFVASDSTKGGTSGVLWSTALFTAARTLLAGQSLSVTYTLRGGGGA